MGLASALKSLEHATATDAQDRRSGNQEAHAKHHILYKVLYARHGFVAKWTLTGRSTFDNRACICEHGSPDSNAPIYLATVLVRHHQCRGPSPLCECANPTMWISTCDITNRDLVAHCHRSEAASSLSELRWVVISSKVRLATVMAAWSHRRVRTIDLPTGRWLSNSEVGLAVPVDAAPTISISASGSTTPTATRVRCNAAMELPRLKEACSCSQA